MARKPKEEAVPEPAKKPPPFIEWPGGTPRFCGNCDHFEAPRMYQDRGHCHNLISGNWRVGEKDNACPNGFYPDVERFPLHIRLGIVPAKEA